MFDQEAAQELVESSKIPLTGELVLITPDEILCGEKKGLWVIQQSDSGNALAELQAPARKLLFNDDGSPTPRTKSIWGHTPMNRFGESHELIGACLFLASHKASSFVTGTNFLVSQFKYASYTVSKGFLTGTNVQLSMNNTLGLKQNSPTNDFNPTTRANLSLGMSQRLLQGFLLPRHALEQGFAHFLREHLALPEARGRQHEPQADLLGETLQRAAAMVGRKVRLELV